MITQHHGAVFLNKDTFARDFTWTPIQAPCSLRYSSRAVEGMGVTGKFRRAPDPSCSCFTVANVHINNKCAKRRSVCIALLLLIRDLCVKLGAVILTGDLFKGAERESATNGQMDQRRISPVEAAFNCGNVPWPTSGVTPLWALAESPTAACCGFVVLPESQKQWLIMRHGSINDAPAAVGLKTMDKTLHYEQWLHLKFAGRKRRRDASPADSKSRQKC